MVLVLSLLVFAGVRLLLAIPNAKALTVSQFGQCPDVSVHATRFLPMDGPISLEICITNCALRPACQMVSFSQTTKICSLFNTSDYLQTSQPSVKDCIYITKDDFSDAQKQVYAKYFTYFINMYNAHNILVVQIFYLQNVFQSYIFHVSF